MNITFSFSLNLFGILVVTAFAYACCLLGQILGALAIAPFLPSYRRADPMYVAEAMIRQHFVKQLVAALVTTIIAAQMSADPFSWSAAVMYVVGFVSIVFCFNRRR
jgi:hypothetical protein